MQLFIALTASLVLVAGSPTRAQQYPPPDQAGDASTLRLSYQTRSTTDDGESSSSSNGADQLIEKVVAVSDDGLELEYDLPPDATAEDRVRNWQFPARVKRMNDGALQLLNAPDLEARITEWLTVGEIPREACGQWIFTWNAFKIECDPQSVLDVLKPYDMRVPELREGAQYQDANALTSVPLSRSDASPEGGSFIAEALIDPERVRQEKADGLAVAAEISGDDSGYFAEQLSRLQTDQVSGSVRTTFQTDTAGRLVRRTTLLEMITTGADGTVERSSSTQTLERLPVRSSD